MTNGNNKMKTHQLANNLKHNGQRALVFQGGGSLGAYEAGVFKALYEKITRIDEKYGEKGRPLFDIVAGTSIGAINAAILVSHVAENKNWKGSPEKLDAFWDYVSIESLADMTPGFKDWWDYWHNINPIIASGEAARRYYSTKQFELTGVSNVFLPFPPVVDAKFMDISNTWFRYDKDPLKTSIEKFAKFPIATNYGEDDHQKLPRLLLVSVDVQEGVTVTFDSYPKKDGSRKSQYGESGLEFGDNVEEEEKGYNHIIRYDDGIKSDYVVASASVPVNYDYTIIEEEGEHSKYNSDTSLYHSKENYFHKNGKRYFWDGGLLSNTPLREVINAHQDYWVNVKGAKNSVPNLEVYIINLHPAKQNYIPLDHDGVVSRNQDITFNDRTNHDVKVSRIMADYINMVRRLIEIAKVHGVTNDIIEKFLNEPAQSKHRTKKPRIYRDLIEGQFSIDNIVRIERNNDPNTISNKIFDFSSGTLKHLRKAGYTDTIDHFDREITDKGPHSENTSTIKYSPTLQK
jgi:NTE family protein